MERSQQKLKNQVKFDVEKVKQETDFYVYGMTREKYQGIFDSSQILQPHSTKVKLK